MTMIERGPPEINFNKVPIGTSERLNWIFGTEVGGVFTPEVLTGRAAEMVFNPGSLDQVKLTAQTNGAPGEVYINLPNTLYKVTAYVLLVEETPGGRKAPRVMGTITPGLAVK